MREIAIKSNRVVTPNGIVKAVVLIRDGLIADVVFMLPDNYAAEVIDIGDKALLPGVTDTHVHINEPGRREWEGFDTSTKAAIAGGITTLVDMPLNSSPVTTSAKAFDEKLAAAKNKIHTNVGFWAGVVPGNEDEIEALADKGVLGFKAFLTPSGIDEFPDVTEGDLRKAMPIIAKRGLPLLVHCELTADVKSQKSNGRSYQQYLDSRPKEWEDKAIAMMIRLSAEFSCRVHIVHLSSDTSIDQIARQKPKVCRLQ